MHPTQPTQPVQPTQHALSARDRRYGRHLDLAALAAAGALALVAFDAVAVPTLPLGTGAWLDAVVNEWIIWFTVLYLLLLGVLALYEKAATSRQLMRFDVGTERRDDPD